MKLIGGVLGLIALLTAIAVADAGIRSLVDDPASATASVTPSGTPDPSATVTPEPPVVLPNGGQYVFAKGEFLIAYYGTPGTGALGVLGERSPADSVAHLKRAARPYLLKGERLQPVFEIIVTVADASAGPDGDYSHDISHAVVRDWIKAAHRLGVLVVLDLQTGRSDFLKVAKRWEWALKDPWVGLALDPEWRMKPGEVPGQVIGEVDAAEINRVGAWLSKLTVDNKLPSKIFMLHQFRRDMITNPAKIQHFPRLAQVQHVDGFGPPNSKVETFDYVKRPEQFFLGWKQFIDEDIPRTTPEQVRSHRWVRFVSFQ